ncbi:MAG: hypothetical protein ABW252_19910 [Polyangiales bacterium]
MDLRIATCSELSEPDPDRAPLDAALVDAGVRACWLAWDDPAIDWSAPVPTVVRTTWNYHLDLPSFLAWSERVARAAPLWNPPDVIRTNTHKGYLVELSQRGVPVVPTTLVARGTTGAPSIASLGHSRVVVKPAVGAGSVGTRAFAGDDPEADAHALRLAADRDVLVQPYVASVDGHGERSLVWIDGVFTHQVRKSPRFAGDSESVTGPFPITPDEAAVGHAALAPWRDQLLYARVDLARDAAGAPMVMEVELTEPSLFFALGSGSAERFVAGIARRLRART